MNPKYFFVSFIMLISVLVSACAPPAKPTIAPAAQFEVLNALQPTEYLW
jgi:hypothetical protein